MACARRQKTGSCSHYQCPYLDETGHGYDCVELILEKYCEVGEGCLSKCEHSWPIGERPVELKAWMSEIYYEGVPELWLRGSWPEI